MLTVASRDWSVFKQTFADDWKVLHEGVIYRHIILTVPAMFRTTFSQNAAVVLSALMRCGAQCLDPYRQEVRMPDEDTMILHITFNDPDLDEEEREREIHNLLYELQQLDEVNEVSRVLDPHPPDGNKAVGAFLAGILQAAVKVQHMRALLGFLSDRLVGKMIEIEVQGYGKKLKVKAHTQAELRTAIAAAQQFISA